MATNDKNRQDMEDRGKQEQIGSPGSGEGRKDDVKGSGVYPASGPLPPGHAEVRGQAEWGQGTRGAEGYEDHGDSETITLPPEDASKS